jgi:hypothetical protein
MECDYMVEEVFSAANWKKHVTKDDCRKRKRCPECKKGRLHIWIGNTTMMGGPTGYMSMERYWSKNPGLAKKNEETLHNESKRMKNFKKDTIERQKRGEQIGPKRKDS